MSSEQKNSFFKQSGWMVMATFLGGIFMLIVHPVAVRRISEEEYGVLLALLRGLLVLTIPAVALQTVFAQQTVSATNEQAKQNLAATTISILKWTSALWLLVIPVILIRTNWICSLFDVKEPMALWLVIPIILTSLWIPVFKGLLQGEHQFGALGWMQITDGVGRLGGTIILLFVFKWRVAGVVMAAVLGQIVTICFAVTVTRKLWPLGNKGSFDAKTWLRAVVPLTLGTGTIIVMASMDMLFVQYFFKNKQMTGLYGAAMYTGFAMSQFIAPITSVMFARIVRSTVLSEGTDALTMTVVITAGFAILAATGASLFPSLPLRIMFAGKPQMLQAAPLVPWYCWALVPLTVANVLVQNLLARLRFQAIPWLVAVPILFVATLRYMIPQWAVLSDVFDGFKRVIMTVGGYSTLLCLIAAWFSWGKRRLPV